MRKLIRRIRWHARWAPTWYAAKLVSRLTGEPVLVSVRPDENGRPVPMGVLSFDIKERNDPAT